MRFEGVGRAEKNLRKIYLLSSLVQTDRRSTQLTTRTYSYNKYACTDTVLTVLADS